MINKVINENCNIFFRKILFSFLLIIVLIDILMEIINEKWNIFFSKNFIPVFINNCFNKYTYGLFEHECRTFPLIIEFGSIYTFHINLIKN